MAGAGVLASWGAARAGAGLVLLATVQSQQPVAAKRAPIEILTQGLPEDREGRLSARAWARIQKSFREFRPDVLVVGPGLGRSKGTKAVVHRLIKTGLPLVLDADGLNTLASFPEPLTRTGPWILTPHAGELARLLKTSVREIKTRQAEAVAAAARRFGCVCLLKGMGTLVTDGQNVWQNTTGNPGMASGGTGDVLSGVIAGLWGQTRERGKEDGFKMAALGVYLHGLAGDLAARKTGEASLLASDVAAFLPAAIKHISFKF